LSLSVFNTACPRKKQQQHNHKITLLKKKITKEQEQQQKDEDKNPLWCSRLFLWKFQVPKKKKMMMFLIIFKKYLPLVPVPSTKL